MFPFLWVGLKQSFKLTFRIGNMSMDVTPNSTAIKSHWFGPSFKLIEAKKNKEGVKGGPRQDDGPGLIFHCGQRPIFTMG